MSAARRIARAELGHHLTRSDRALEATLRRSASLVPVRAGDSGR